MRVIKEDSGLMIIKQRNILFFGITIFFIILGFNILFNPNSFISETPPFWFGLISILAGSLALFSIKMTTIRLDKSENKISIQKKRITGRPSSETFTIEDVKEIELVVDFSSIDEKKAYSYQLYFVLNNGRNIELGRRVMSSDKSPGLLFSSQIRVGKRISSFLRVPFQEQHPPTTREKLSVFSKVIKNPIIKNTKK